MKKLTISSVIVVSILLTACAEVTGWSPTVDPYNDRNAYRIPQDTTECKQLAGQSSGTAKDTAIGAATGGLIGAAAGGFGGGTYKGLSAEEAYKRAYTNCMRNRGHNVVN